MNTALVSFVLLMFAAGPAVARSVDDAAAGKVKEPPPRVAVVEVYTSEGCSSCPPADELLGTLEEKARAMNRAKDGTIIAGQNPVIVYPLAFHVDYWDRLGWPDRFASAQFTARQKRYVEAMHSRSLYTPQAIVNGERDVVANQEKSLLEAIREAKVARVNIEAKVAARKTGEAIIVEVKLTAASGALGKNLIVNAALTESNLITDVKRGENAGRKLRHSHVVRALEADLYEPKADEPLRLTLAFPKEVVEANSKVVVWVQDKGVREVLGATAVELVKPPNPPEMPKNRPAGEQPPTAPAR